MKKKNVLLCIVVLMLIVVLAIAIAACATKVSLTLNFIVDGKVYATVETDGQETIRMPADPKKPNATFEGWYWDEGTWTRPFTANSLLQTPLTSNASVYAKFRTEEEPVNTELRLEGFTLIETEELGKAYYISLPNSQLIFDVAAAVTIDNRATWSLSVDLYGNHTIASKRVDLEVGDNIYYILVQNQYGKSEQYTVLLRRRPLYTVTFDTAGGTPCEQQVVEEGECATAPTTKRDGYTFSWDYDFDKPIEQNTVVTATWTVTQYTITYHLNDEFLDGKFPAQNPNASTCTAESAITFQPATRDHYKFEGWFKEPTFDHKVTELSIGSHGDIDLYAKWSAVEYTITYHLNDEFANSKFPAQNLNTTLSYTVESAITLQPATRNCFNFVGWFADANLQNRTDGLSLGTFGNKDLYAKWSAIEYTITYHLNDEFLDGSFLAKHTNVGIYTAETFVTFSNATRDNYNFVGWFKESTFDTQVTELPVGSYGNVDLYAKWSAVEYTITYYLNDEFENSKFPAQNPNTSTYTVESRLSLQPAIRNGFDFVAWYSEQELLTEVSELSLGTFGNKDLYAKWSAIEYTITYHLNDEFLDHAFPATNGNETTSYTIENAVSFDALVTRDHYNFVGWFKESTFDTQVKELSAGSYGNVELYAKWSAVEYTITYHLNDEFMEGKFPAQNPNTTVSYTVESAITLQPATRNGFDFVAWCSDRELQTEVSELPLGCFGNKEFWANWEIATYTITYHLNDEFLENAFPATNGNETNYTIENTVALSNATRNHYNFVGWFKEPTFDNKVTELPVGSYGNLDLYAKWMAVEYTITYHLSNEEWVNEPDIENDNNVFIYTAEQSVTFTNPTHPHYTFKGWYKEPTFDTQVTNISVGNYGNLDLYAKWWYGTDGLVYSEQGDDYQVTGYRGSSKSVAIPNVWDGRNVTSIGEYAFGWRSSLREITIPENITVVGDRAFEYCENLSTVNWNATNCTSVGTYHDGAPSYLTYSSDYDYTLFYLCTSLATVNVGANVTSIPAYAFV